MTVKYEDFISCGYKLHVKITNNSQKDNLLLLHGFNDNKETFVFMEDYFSNYFNILSFDFRGHGDSQWKTEGIYNHAESILDIHNVINRYFPDKPIVIGGHSMGAGLAARYSGLFPDKIKALFCVEGFSGIAPLSKERHRIIEWLQSMNRQSKKEEPFFNKKFRTISEAAHRLRFIFYKIQEDRLETIAKNLLNHTEDGGWIWKADPALKHSYPIPFPPELSRELWEQIQCPVIILFGSQSKLKANNMTEILSHFKNQRYYELEDSGHNLHHEQPEKLIELLEKFFKENNIVEP